MRGQSGQALVEWALLLPLYAALIVATVVFGQWFAIRHQLIAAAREGAFLYSSGRIKAKETQKLVQANLLKGFPSIEIPLANIIVGPSSSKQARLFRLDEVRIIFHLSPFLKGWGFQDMEETCVIKHAPSYWQTELSAANLGPPVPW